GGGEILSGQGSAVVQVRWDAVSGAVERRVSVQAASGGGCVASSELQVMVYPNPVPEISGVAVMCVNAGEQTYSTALVSGNTYAWTVSGGEILTGQGSAVVAVRWSTS